FGGKTSIFSHPVYLFLREFSLQDFRGGSVKLVNRNKPSIRFCYLALLLSLLLNNLIKTHFQTHQTLLRYGGTFCNTMHYIGILFTRSGMKLRYYPTDCQMISGKWWLAMPC
ncbi:hypothetical protein SM970_22660, partial [Escherichia coli]|nr:hypothetical protein [Escherichia coli]